jgi:hypothetical protein
VQGTDEDLHGEANLQHSQHRPEHLQDQQKNPTHDLPYEKHRQSTNVAQFPSVVLATGQGPWG